MDGELVGLVPAAGHATRLGSIPCSKEILPLGLGDDGKPKVAVEHLLDAFRIAGARRAFIVLREGKWDIPAYLQDGEGTGVPLGYLIMRLPFGQPYTAYAAVPFVERAVVLFGFPDILFAPEDAFGKLLDRREETRADVVLGLFPATQPQKMDMVELDQEQRVRDIVIKPRQTHLEYTWIIAAWTPVFTAFLRDLVSERVAAHGTLETPPERELFMGDVLRSALDRGIAIEAVTFAEGEYVDIGTPEDLATALRWSPGAERRTRNPGKPPSEGPAS